MERRKFTRGFQLEALRLIAPGRLICAGVTSLSVHVSQLRSWVKAFADDPQQTFPGRVARAG